MARIKDLVAGEVFRTLLTGRSGQVVPVSPLMRAALEVGVPVRFDDGELKTLHPDVKVAVVALGEVTH
jgi:hypothetical protein